MARARVSISGWRRDATDQRGGTSHLHHLHGATPGGLCWQHRRNRGMPAKPGEPRLLRHGRHVRPGPPSRPGGGQPLRPTEEHHDNPDPNDEHFSFRFKKHEHMQRLANPRAGIKAILIVMATHPYQRLWATGGHESLSLLHCCYWASLEGETVPVGVESPTVSVRTSNIFTADTLSAMLDQLERGEELHG